MKDHTYKILVLSDLKKTTGAILKSSVSLAKMIDAEIAVFHVKNHTEIVDRENQLSAIRTLNEEHNNTKKEIEALVKTISKDYDVTIQGSYSFGKVKEEIRNQIELYNPDIIVLGQRNSNPLQLIGDSITRFILKEFKGSIMISGHKNGLIPDEKMTLGIFNGSDKIFNTTFSKDLITHSNTPLKSFKIVSSQEEIIKTTAQHKEQVVEYVFEQNANTMTTLSSYLLKNNINLLCVDRNDATTKNTMNIPLKEVVSKLNISLLVSKA
ncbi:universal stress protein [Psychroserpens mesophilus]|uniref:universal stress protein n=1 Tax=Psychroserpens mesophilus TaxID=325473 RepID=UPI003D64BF54